MAGQKKEYRLNYTWRRVMGCALQGVAFLLSSMLGFAMVAAYTGEFGAWFAIAFPLPLIAAVTAYLLIFRNLSKGRYSEKAPKRLPFAIVTGILLAVLSAVLIQLGTILLEVPTVMAGYWIVATIAPLFSGVAAFIAIRFLSPYAS